MTSTTATLTIYRASASRDEFVNARHAIAQAEPKYLPLWVSIPAVMLLTVGLPLLASWITNAGFHF